MEDRQIVDLYWERSESAIAETEKKYGRYCHYIAYRILEDDEDAKEIVNDTYLKTWQTIPPKRPDSLKPYVGMISRQLALNAYEEQHAQKRGQLSLVLDELSECLPSDGEDWDVASGVALHDSLNAFLKRLPQKTRHIFSRTGAEPNCPTTMHFRIFRRAFTRKISILLRKITPKSIKNAFADGCEQF